MDDGLIELLELAVPIKQLEADEEHNRATGQWKEAKQQFESLEAEFARARERYIDQLLRDSVDGADPVQRVDQQLKALRATCEASWYPGLDYLSENLLPSLRKEAKKSPFHRKAMKALPFVLAGALALAYFGTRIVQSGSITAAYDSRAGIEQRAEALTKVLRYDDWANTRVRRGGWLKGILLWPIEPTESEVQGASEFVGIALEAHKVAASDFGCGPLVGGDGQNISDSEIEFLGSVADHVNSSNLQWQEPPVLTVLDAARRSGGC